MLEAVGRGAEARVTVQVSWVEGGDPVVGFVRRRLGWDWPQLTAVAFIIYGPIEKILIPATGRYLHLDGPITEWIPDAEALLLGFLVFPAFFAFYLWASRGIVEAFSSVERNEGFARDGRCLGLLRRAQEDFRGRAWTLVSLGFAVLAVLAVHVVLWGPEAAVPPWFGAANVAHRVLALVLIGCVGYVVAQIVIREILAVLWLGRLFDAIGDDLVVHPYHADGAGGLGAIGRHAANLLYLLTMVAVFVGLGSLLPWLRGMSELQVSFWNPLIAVLWAVFLTLGPLLVGLVILPPHQAMCRARDRWMSVVSRQLDEQLAAAEASISGNRGALPAILKEIKRLKDLRQILLNDFPTWPVSDDIQGKIRLSAIIPVAQYVGTIVLTQLGFLGS